MDSESQNDAHEHLSRTEDEEDVLNAFNFPTESVKQNTSTDVSMSYNARHQGEPDPEGKDLKVKETDSVEVGPIALFNTQELLSGTNHEHIDPVEDAEQLNPGTTTTESRLQHQVDHSLGLDRNTNSHADDLDNKAEDAVSSLFAESSGLVNGGDIGGESGRLSEELKEEEIDAGTQDYRLDDDNPPPEEVDLPYQDQETGPTQTHQEAVEANNDPESGGFESYQRNPFDDLEDPEFEDGFFGSKADDPDNALDPESQGYSLLQDNDYPEGSTSTDVHDSKEGHTEDQVNQYSFSLQQGEQLANKINAFPQVQGSISEGVTGPAVVAYQLVDPSNPKAKGIESENSAGHDKGVDHSFGDEWWGSSENNQDFNFGGAEDLSNVFNSNDGDFPEFSQQSEAQEDPFAQIIQSNGSQSHHPITTKNEPETGDLFDDEGFAALFPTPHNNPPPQPAKELSPPSVLAPVSSLFGNSPDEQSLFNAPDNFPIAPTKDAVPENVPSTQQVPGLSEPSVASDDILATDDLLDDLDFIDDSEFMAALGASTTEIPAVQPAPVQSSSQSNGTGQSQKSRYLPQSAPIQPLQNRVTPQQTYTQPGQTQFTPQQTYTQPGQTQVSPPPASEVAASPSQPARSTSNRYTPSAAPRPGVPAVPTTRSPQVHATQPTWSQPAAPRRPLPTQTPSSMTSSFVTAKGAYSSPYDLPPQIATKQKRHIPPPIPIYQQPPQADPRPPLSAHIHPPLSTAAPPRAASAQPRFPAQQQRQYLPAQGDAQGQQSQYAPPTALSPPLRSPTIQGASQYDARRVVSPPLPHSTRNQQLSQSLYAPRRDFSPPLQQSPSDVKFPPPTAYTPGTAAPPHHAQAAGQVYGPERAISPPSHLSPPGAQYQGIPVSQAPPQTVYPPGQSVLSKRYAPGQRLIPPRSVSTQQLHSTVQPASQGRTQDISQYGQPQVSSPPSLQQYPIHQQTQQTQPAQRGHFPGPQTQPLHAMKMDQSPFPPSNLAPSSQYQHQHQQPPFAPPQDTFYPPPPTAPSHFDQDPHADLPPHFAMESGEYDQMYDPEGLMGPPMQFHERNIMRTPEPMDGHQPDSFNNFSQPGSLERTATLGDYPSPPKTRPFSPYDPRGSVPPVPQVSPPSTTERHRSVSPQVTRTSISSPKKDMTTERSLSYPSRKAPPHIRAMAAPSAPRTQEEDFQFRRGGYPIVTFGFGGRMITMIPRTPHRVNIRGSAPISVPGMITFSSLREFTEPPGLASSFPGPLHSANKPVKGKAKDIGKWLDDNLTLLEQFRETRHLEEEDIKRIEDRKILYKLVKLLVDNNGVLDGNLELEKSVKEILLPQAVSNVTEEGSQSFGITASSLATSMAAQSTTPDPNALATYNLTTDFLRSMRSLLMKGDRQNAIRKAIDQKMWGHALLIASSVDKIVWRETVEQFIRSELRDPGTNDFDSLRFLYGVLGGEAHNAVNELLPPINRMVSSIHPSATSQTPRVRSWKEGLGVVLMNQGSMDTSPALIGLGSSLVSEGRVEAGHTCFLLTKLAAKFSALDEPDTNYSLVGADHLYGKGSHVGLPQVLLSEIVEYSQSRFAPDGFLHLLPYKLWHAWTLTDYGYSDIAEKYCESIGATLQKEKKGSIFITPTLIDVLRELTERISESSQLGFSEKASWFGGKTSTRGENFWKALETNLTKFVAGDETNEDSTSIANVTKPVDVRFGRIASDTSLNRMASLPNLRAHVTTPVYGQFLSETMRAPGAHSRYNIATSESRYTPGVRHEQAPVSPIQEYDMGTSENTPGSRIATPEVPNRGYSPYVPPTQSQSQPYSLERVYTPYAPAPAPATPVEKEEEPDEPEGTVARQEQETDAAKEEEKEKEKEKEEKEKEKEKKPAVEKSGWFGGWFRRGASAPPEGSSTSSKPIKAKLGEESSFVYDTDLKRWVNKKAGDVPVKPTPAPPPPKRPASKTPSIATPPAPGITPRTAIPPQVTTTQPPAPTPSSSAIPPAAGATPKDPALPPSRPTSTASRPPGQTVDPLEALLSTRSVSGARGVKKPARSKYVDVMNKK